MKNFTATPGMKKNRKKSPAAVYGRGFMTLDGILSAVSVSLDFPGLMVYSAEHFDHLTAELIAGFRNYHHGGDFGSDIAH